jgi:outer membrane lipoprotein-sorting protein
VQRKLGIALSLVLLLGLTLSACGDKITAEEIVAEMQETMESTTDAHAVVTADVDVQGIALSVTAEVWEKMPYKARAVVLDASEAGYLGTTFVTDGDQAWLYEPEHSTVTVGPLGEIDMPLPQEMITSLQEVIQAVLDASDIELVGEEAVAGREAYKLTMSPKEGAELEFLPGGGLATLWVDKEQWIVLKATYEASSLGQGSLEMESFELNPGLADDLFSFEIPEGAKVIDVEAQQAVPLTLDEARQQAGFALLVPEYVPEGTTLIEVFRSGDLFILRYDHSPAASFTVVQASETAAFPSPELLGFAMQGRTDVTVRGHGAEAIVDEVGSNTFLLWTEDGVTLSVAGHISLEEALRVAESLQ